MSDSYVPGGNGSGHKGQSVEKTGGQGSQRGAFAGYKPSACNISGVDTPKPKDGSKKSPKIFG